VRSAGSTAPIAAVALVYAATLWALPPGGLWIVDNGNKRIQVEALLASGFRDFSLPWPGRPLDPELAFNPVPSPFSSVRDGRLYSIFSPAFPALAALPFRVLGEPGLCLLPLFASLAGLACIGRIARLAELPAEGCALAILIAGLATPLWFYSVVFWEHAVAASLCAAAVALALGCVKSGSLRQACGAGLAIALGAGMRDPLLLFAALLGALILLAAPRARLRAALAFSAGLAGGLLPLAVFQWLALGEPLGFHLTHGFASGSPGGPDLAAHLRDRPQAFYRLFLAAAGSPALSLLATGPPALLLLFQPRLPRPAYRAALVGVAVWGLAGAIAMAAGLARAPIAWLLESNGFFAAAPLLWVGLLRCRDPRVAPHAQRLLRWLGRLVLAHALLYAALSPLRNTGGIHWGNRYLLELYPLLAVPCAAALLEAWRLPGRGRATLAALGGLVAASVALQGLSIDLLKRKLVFGDNLERAVREHSEAVIVTDQWWVPQTLAREFFDRPMFLITRPEQRNELLSRLSRRGDRDFLFVTVDAGRPPNPRARVIEDEGLGFFTLRLETHRLPGARSDRAGSGRRSSRRGRRPIHAGCRRSGSSCCWWSCSRAAAWCCRCSTGAV
jgi:hypothetical protein